MKISSNASLFDAVVFYLITEHSLCDSQRLGCLALNALTPSSSEEVRSATLREMERQAHQKSPAAALPSSEVQPVIPESEDGTETSE